MTHPCPERGTLLRRRPRIESVSSFGDNELARWNLLAARMQYGDATTLLGASRASVQVHLGRPRRLGFARVGPSRRRPAVGRHAHAVRVFSAKRRRESLGWTCADARRERRDWAARQRKSRITKL